MVDRSKTKPGFLLCLTYHLPNISGLTLSAHEIVKHVAALGHPVRVVAARHPRSAVAHELVDGVEVRRVSPWLRLSKAPIMPAYPLAVWRGMDGMAVVNVHLPCLDAATVAIIAKLRGRRLVVSYISSMSKERAADRIFRVIGAFPHLIAGMLADRIVIASASYVEQSTFCRLFARKISPAPLPVPLRLLPGENPQARRLRLATSEDPYRIGYVGRIARQKSLHVLLAAVPRLVERLGGTFLIELLGPATDVVGETDWHDILADVERSGGRIRYCGVKTGRELADYYASLDALVLPSTNRLESFGLVQVEAMLRGVPVVASDLPGMRAPIAETGMGRLFPAGDAKALADALADVLINGPPARLTAREIEARFGHDTACRPYLDELRRA
jgi:glycosyltransferase involved in cell wall biosynthesis